jgi:hypothetical protein
MLNNESEVLVSRAKYKHILNGCVVGAGRELAIDEDACGEVDLALEGLIVEFIGESCRRHCCVMSGGVTRG